MKISIEFKDDTYTVTYGKMVGTGPTVAQALDAIVNQFRSGLEKFFVK